MLLLSGPIQGSLLGFLAAVFFCGPMTYIEGKSPWVYIIKGAYLASSRRFFFAPMTYVEKQDTVPHGPNRNLAQGIGSVSHSVRIPGVQKSFCILSEALPHRLAEGKRIFSSEGVEKWGRSRSCNRVFTGGVLGCVGELNKSEEKGGERTPAG